MRKAEISNLVQSSSHLWQGDRHLPGRVALSTGFAELDRVLPFGGWPSGVVWLDYPRAGIGELRLLSPAMRQIRREQRRVVWVNPPYQPYTATMPAALELLELINETRPDLLKCWQGSRIILETLQLIPYLKNCHPRLWRRIVRDIRSEPQK